MARVVAVTGVLLFLALFDITMSTTVQEYFNVGANLTQIKWSHATNNLTLLTTALNSTEIHMIEADVVLGKLQGAGNDTEEIPIMAHPPKKESDLSLDNFLIKVLANNETKKGIKLDFKTIDAYEKGLVVLKKHNLTKIPVWLNADILKGPVDATDEPVNSQKFLDLATQVPQALLSIGWTTRLEASVQNATASNYTTAQLTEMSKLVTSRNLSQSVTYPVRACFAANSVEGLNSLLKNTTAQNSTLTIWSSEGDPVNVTRLNELIKQIGINKLYIDVPTALAAQLDLSGSSAVKTSLSVLALIVAVVTAKFL